MSGWLLGLDAGGTRTRAVLAGADRRIVERADAGPCNWTALPFETCVAAIDAAWASLRPRVGSDEVAAVCLCSAGFYPPHHREPVEAALRRRWPGAVLRLETDLAAAWAGALGGEPGIVLVAGTGSVAFGRLADGREARSGGWGPLFGDEGSAYWLAVRALQAVSHAGDGRGDPTRLGEVLARGTDPLVWLRDLHRTRPGREEVAALAPAVLAAATEGDAVATRLVQATVEEWGRMVHAVERALGAPGGTTCSWSGGLITGAPELRGWLSRWLGERGSGLALTPPRFDSGTGALLLAAAGLGGPVPHGLLATS